MGALAVTTILVLFLFLHQVDGSELENKTISSSCDIFKGKWVYDASYNPLYNARKCPFIGQEFDCQKNGRPDSLYLKYRWKPTSCKLPRFKGRDLLKRYRRKAHHTYNVSIMLSRNAYLVDAVCEKGGRVLKLNSVDQNGELWKGADTLIFDSWHWWLHTGKKQAWDMIEDGNNTYKDMDRSVAYGKALKTWANWVNTNVDSPKTKIFLPGISPDHMK
ncbi:hypothetical protein Q3G72_001898 [Acer saccharum]|nr:hypothetical protein Q3G72_001898 [Acer saccharum]